jgi:hypothetical protein
MLNLNTMNFPLDAVPLLAPPRSTKQAGAVVVVENPVPAFKTEPSNDVTSLFVVAVIQVLELFVPFRYRVPDPKLAV